MRSKIKDVVYSEPAGRLTAFGMLAGSLVLASTYIYYDLLHDVSSIHLLVMAVGFALSGFAEAISTERRQVAGGLRVTAILLLLGLLSLTIFAPDVIFGP
ncbi:hypothetical protein [Haloarchaeobius sp. DFWS5]|uniref:hypothetical protein n=1 Tax=Haloarchaeobius sp. DFWS5 TaxID=3446114 RepID=UPI003EBD5E03